MCMCMQQRATHFFTGRHDHEKPTDGAAPSNAVHPLAEAIDVWHA